MDIDGDLAICVACGTQYDDPLTSPPSVCRICEDPRQFVPPTGQVWTSLSAEKGKQHNEVVQDEYDPRIWYISTIPKLGIGERAFFIQTDEGNVLWDLVAWIDRETVEWIQSHGGLKAIVISHPHFYTTHLTWSRALDVPVFTHAADSEWLSRPDPGNRRRLLNFADNMIVPQIHAIQLGGHFPGSLILHSSIHTGNQVKGTIFVADTLFTAPSAHNPPASRTEETHTFSFMWSIPNQIPLDPITVNTMWERLKKWTFGRSLGGFAGQDVRDEEGLERRVLQSMKIQVSRMGWQKGMEGASILSEDL